jgi:hypothetical protein
MLFANHTQKLLGSFVTCIVAFVLVLLALHPSWQPHAQSDVYFTFFARSQHFAQHGNFQTLKFNEYPPGTLAYFVLHAPLFWLNPALTPQTYVTLFVLMNATLFVLISGFIAQRWGRTTWAVWLLILFAFGPLTFFRFELFCMCFVLLALAAWQRQQFGQSVFWLCIASSIKLFPILFIPILLVDAFRRSHPATRASLLKSLSMAVLAFVLGLSVCLYWWQLSLATVVGQLSNHTLKPIGIDSIPGNLYTLYTLATHRTPWPVVNILINGFDAPRVVHRVLERAWIGFYIVLFSAWMKSQRHNWPATLTVLITMLAIFLCTAPQLLPQYYLWCFCLIPLLSHEGKSHKRYRMIVVLTCVIGMFNQLTFPVFYTELLDAYYRGPLAQPIVFLLLLKNAIYGVLIYLLLKHWKALTHNADAVTQTAELPNSPRPRATHRTHAHTKQRSDR